MPTPRPMGSRRSRKIFDDDDEHEDEDFDPDFKEEYRWHIKNNPPNAPPKPESLTSGWLPFSILVGIYGFLAWYFEDWHPVSILNHIGRTSSLVLFAYDFASKYRNFLLTEDHDDPEYDYKHQKFLKEWGQQLHEFLNFENGAVYARAAKFFLATHPFPVTVPGTIAVYQERPLNSDVNLESLVQKELNRPFKEIFKEAEKRPFSFDGLHQLYKAKLLDGTSVVLKVRYPHVVGEVKHDLWVLKKLFERIRKVYFADMDFEVPLQQFEKYMLDALDSRNEARNIAMVNEALIKHNLKATTPIVIQELSTEKMLTTVYEETMPVQDLWALRENSINPKHVMRHLLDIYGTLIFKEGIVMLPTTLSSSVLDANGNILLLQHDATMQLSKPEREELVDYFLKNGFQHFEYPESMFQTREFNVYHHPNLWRVESTFLPELFAMLDSVRVELRLKTDILKHFLSYGIAAKGPLEVEKRGWLVWLPQYTSYQVAIMIQQSVKLWHDIVAWTYNLFGLTKF